MFFIVSYETVPFRFLYILIVLLCILGCSKINTEPLVLKEVSPPNCVKIAPNLWVDETEVTNSFWKEYAFWNNKHNRGNDYIPDTTVWLSEKDEYHNLAKVYYRNAEFDSYPVVGISIDQARAYASWRSNIVNEMLLIEQGRIGPIRGSRFRGNKNNRNFRRGAHTRTRKELDVDLSKHMVRKVKFSLPTLDEMNQIVLYFKNSKMVNNDNSSIIKVNKWYVPTSHVRYSEKDKKVLYHLDSNVSELLAEGYTFGSNWKTQRSEPFAVIGNSKLPNAWTGFRCVCRWVDVEE